MSTPEGEYGWPTKAIAYGYLVLCVSLLSWFLTGDLIVAMIFMGGLVLSVSLVFLAKHSPESVKKKLRYVRQSAQKSPLLALLLVIGLGALFLDVHNFSFLMPWKRYVYAAGLIPGLETVIMLPKLLGIGPLLHLGMRLKGKRVQHVD